MENQLSEGEQIQFESSYQYLQHFIKYSTLQLNEFSNNYSAQYIASIIPINLLEAWSQTLKPPHSEISLPEFIAIACSAIPHEKNETLFLMLGLKNIYKDVLRRSKVSEGKNVKFSTITDLLCEKIGNVEENKICIRARQKVEEEKKSPNIRLMFKEDLPIMRKEKINKEKSLKGDLKHFCYSEKMAKIISLASLDTKLEIYDKELKCKNVLIPNSSIKFKKESIILSFAYSEKHRRIGCVIHNFGLVFWEAIDNFETEKTIENIKADSIFYINYLDIWGTIKDDKVSFWDIYEEKECNSILFGKGAEINCLTEVNYLGIILISVTFKNKKKELRSYQLEGNNWRSFCKVELDSSGCNFILPNPSTQSILQIGFSYNVKVWQCEQETYDLTEIGELSSYGYIVISAVNVGSNGIVATGDDKGNVRLWNLKELRCFQKLNIGAREILGLLSINKELVVGDNRISFIEFEPNNSITKASIKGRYICQFFDSKLQKLYIFTSNSCSITDIENGEVSKILILCDFDEEILCITQHKNLFCLGTSKGNVKIMDNELEIMRSVKAHESCVNKIVSGGDDQFIITVSMDSIAMWMNQNSMEVLELRKTMSGIWSELDNYEIGVEVNTKQQIVGMLFNKHELIILDLETFKLQEKFIFQSQISTFKFHSSQNLIIVSTKDRELHFIKFEKIETQFSVIKRIRTNNNIFISLSQEEKLSNDFDEYHTHLEICNDDLICFTNFGFIEIYDLGKLEIFQHEKENLKGGKKSETNLFRSIREDFAKICKEYEENRRKQKLRKSSPSELISELKLKSRENMEISCPFKFVAVNQSLNTISIISQKGTLKIFDYASHKCICSRSVTSYEPLIWIKPKMSPEKIKVEILGIMKIIEAILSKKISHKLERFVCLSKIMLPDFVSFGTKPTLEEKKEIKQITDENIEINQTDQKLKVISSKSHRRAFSVLESNNLSLKSMETEKRVRNISLVKEVRTEDRYFSINHKIKYAEKLQAKKENPLYDTFYRHSIEHKLLKEETDDKCEIFNRIYTNYQKWKTSDKMRSSFNATLTSFGKENRSSKQEKLIRSNSKNILKWKIDHMQERKDHCSKMLRKIFRADFKELPKLK